MNRTAHLSTIRDALIVSLCTLASAAAMAGDGKWVQDAKSCAAPEYPRDSLNKGEQGTTGLRILVGVDGKAIDSEIETSSHSHKLDTAAQRALMECSFKPQPADASPPSNGSRPNSSGSSTDRFSLTRRCRRAARREVRNAGRRAGTCWKATVPVGGCGGP